MKKFLTALLFLASFVSAQGMMPKTDSTQASKPAASYLLIGDTVPQSLTVLDKDGKPRALLSFKAATDALVGGFYSPRCAKNQTQCSALKRYYEDLKGWHASFVGVSVNSDETLKELSDAMAEGGLPYPAVRDDHQRV